MTELDMEIQQLRRENAELIHGIEVRNANIMALTESNHEKDMRIKALRHQRNLLDKKYAELMAKNKELAKRVDKLEGRG